MRGSSLWVRSRKGRLRTGCVVFKEAKRSADTLHTCARALHTFASYLVKLKLLRGDISQNLTSQNVLPSGARTGSRARRCRGSSLSRRTHRSPHTLLRITAALGHCTSGPLDWNIEARHRQFLNLKVDPCCSRHPMAKVSLLC